MKIATPRSPRLIKLLDALQTIVDDEKQDGPTRVLAGGIVAQTLGVNVDLAIGIPPAWGKSSFVRIRNRIDPVAKRHDKEAIAEARKRRKLTRAEKAKERYLTNTLAEIEKPEGPDLMPAGENK